MAVSRCGLTTVVYASLLISGCGSDLHPGQRTGPGQPEVFVDSSLCGGCTVLLDTVWTSSVGNTDITSTPHLIELATGSIVTIDRQGTTGRRLLKLGPDGRTVDTFGREGRGPGEFMTLAWAGLSPDGQTIFAGHGRRLTLVDSGFVYDGSASVPVQFVDKAAAVLPDESIVVGTAGRDEEGRIWLQHRIDPRTGEVLNRYDEFEEGDRPYRVLSATRDGLVWASPLTRPPAYALELWDPVSGRQVNTLRPNSPWFDEWNKEWADVQIRPGPVPSRPSSPLVLGVEQHDDIVWVLLRVWDAEWDKVEDSSDYMSRFDTILEGRFAATGELVASVRFDQMSLLSSRGNLVLIDQTENLEPIYRLVQFRLTP